jgi:two-component system, OmpR family, phosphate regulon sensor histidine kinase PhoR
MSVLNRTRAATKPRASSPPPLPRAPRVRPVPVEAVPPRRPTYIGYAQVPFVSLVAVVAILARGLDLPASGTTSLFVGLALAGVVTVLAFVLPWRRLDRAWLVALASADIVVVGVLREALFTTLPGVDILLVFPVLWLCYAFRWPVLLLGVAGAFAVTLFPFARLGEFPEDTRAWGDVLLLPAAASLLAVAVHVAALHLRAQQDAVHAMATDLRASLLEVLDRDVTTRAVLDTVDAGIALYDPAGAVLLSNSPFSAGPAERHAPPTVQVAEEAEIFEADRTTPMPPEDRIIARAARGELTTRRTFWVGTGTNQRAVLATSQYARRASGELIGTVVATHDVTQLAEAIRSRDEFLTTVSHELKTPLTSILGYLDVLEGTADAHGRVLGPELEAVQRNSRRLQTLIAALLATAQGHVSVDRRPYDVSRLVENTVSAAQPAAANALVRLIAHTRPGLTAEIDAALVGSMLDALIANGIAFTEAGGVVSVSAASEGADAVIRVIDTGIGMNPDDLTRVFDRFFRASATRAAEVPGSGLGLAAAKVVVDAHRGSIVATSIEGLGTTFEVRLPLRSADVGDSQSAPAPARPAGSSDA